MDSYWSNKLGSGVYKHLKERSKLKGVDHVLVLNVLRHESGGNPNAISSVGAMGLMQVMPMHFKSCGMSKPLDPIQNITCGVGILASTMHQAKGDARLGLAMYNGAPKWARRMHRLNWPCLPYRRGVRNDCLQNKFYVKNIYTAYVADLNQIKKDDHNA